MEQKYQREINVKRIEILYQNGYIAVIGMLIMSITAILVIYNLVWPADQRPDILFAWLVMYMLVSVIRLYGIALYQKSQVTIDQVNYWLYAYLSGVVISAILWATLFLYLVHYLSPMETNFMLFYIVGMISAAVGTYATSFLAFFIASTTLLTPIIIYFMLHPDPQSAVQGFMLIIYLLFLLIISRQLNRILCRYLEHEFNAHQLEREKNYAAMINRELEEEIIKRIDAEDKLKSEVYRAEALADKLLAISSSDGLTGINNRRRFDEYLQNEWNRSARTGSELSLILCDIDNYKAFNDTYGHLAGDDCLKKIAHVLEDYSRRAGDMAARYGGEEFTLILPDTSLKNAVKIAEDIRVAVLDLRIPHSASDVSDYLTVSLGVATVIPDRHGEPESLIKSADDALYKAKHEGRNRVISMEKPDADRITEMEE